MNHTTQIVQVSASPGSVTVVPEPANAKLGETVQWSLQVDGRKPGSKLTLVIRFENLTPFHCAHEFRASTIAQGDGSGRVILDAGATTSAGEYKYDVSLIEDGSTAFDLDPSLIVQP